MRFHSLPESKRYADSDAERAEILCRHNTVIDELLLGSRSGDRALAVVTCSWSSTADPAPRDEALMSVSPFATYWQSVLTDVDEERGEEFWSHLYVHLVAWQPGALDDLLLLVADWQTSDVIVGPANWEWLYLPYDGGADITVSSVKLRNSLRNRHADWLSDHPQGL